MLTAAFYAVLLPETLITLFDRDTSLSLRFYETFKCLVLITAIGLFYVLQRQIALTLSRLRTIEMVLFGMVLLQFVWVDYRTLFDRRLPAVIAAGVDESFGLLVVGAQLLTWFVLIVSYGILIPNTWRRCALVLGMIATIPVGLSAAAGLIGDGIPRDLLADTSWPSAYG